MAGMTTRRPFVHLLAGEADEGLDWNDAISGARGRCLQLFSVNISTARKTNAKKVLFALLNEQIDCRESANDLPYYFDAENIVPSECEQMFHLEWKRSRSMESDPHMRVKLARCSVSIKDDAWRRHYDV